MSRTYKKKYTGSKAVDATCRSNGGCPYCYASRLHSTLKRAGKHAHRRAQEESVKQVFEEETFKQLEIIGEEEWNAL